MRKRHVVALAAMLILLSANAVPVAAQNGLPDNSFGRDINRAADLFGTGNTKGAEQILEKSIAMNQGSDKETMATAVQLLGMCYEQQGNRKRADETYKAVLEQYPGTRGAIRAQFRLDTMAGKPTKPRGRAITPEQLEREFKSEKNAKKAANIASAMIWQHANRESIQVARQVCEQYVLRFGYIEETQEVMFALASAHESAGLFNDARRLMDELFRKFPKAEANPQYLIKYGYGLNLTGSSMAAIGIFNRALGLHPDKFLRAKALLGKGIAYRNLRQPREASLALAKARKLSKEIGDSMNLEDIDQLDKEIGQMSDGDIPDNTPKNHTRTGLFPLIALILMGTIVVVRIVCVHKSGRRNQMS